MSLTLRLARTRSRDFTFFGHAKISSRYKRLLIFHNAYVADTTQGTKDTGLVGDGTVLPPFIATTKKVSDVFDPPIEEEYKISYMPDDKVQSVNMMIKYLDWLHARG